MYVCMHVYMRQQQARDMLTVLVHWVWQRPLLCFCACVCASCDGCSQLMEFVPGCVWEICCSGAEAPNAVGRGPLQAWELEL